MSFLLLLLAWFLFGLGFINLFAEAYEEADKRVNDKSVGLSSFSYILYALSRVFFIASCFASWYWLLFR